MIDALERREKIIQENAFKQKKKKPRLKFNPGLALICLQTTGPSALKNTGKLLLAVFEPTLLSRKGRGSFHGGVVHCYICYHFHSCHFIKIRKNERKKEIPSCIIPLPTNQLLY